MSIGLGVHHFKHPQCLLASFGLALWATLATAADLTVAHIVPFTSQVSIEANEYNAGV